MFRLVFVVGVTFLVHTSADSLPEGASCDHKGVQGTCRNTKLCPSYTVLPAERAEATICSHNGDEEIVCCTDCHSDDGIKAEATLTLDGIVWKTGGVSKSYDKCVDYAASLPYPCKDGVTVTPKKVYDAEKKCHRVDVSVQPDPTAAQPERVDFPNLALLGFVDKESGRARWQCHGFIISERFIVSTAHCGRDLYNGPVAYIAVGIDKRIEPGTTPAGWQQYKVKRFIPHPEWHSSSKYNDIGLLETDTEIQFSVNVLPMCLSDRSTDPDTVQADILGIDKIQDNKKVEIQKLSQTECSELISSRRYLKEGLNFITQTCYKGFNETEESCRGSSGRPIYVSGDLKCMNYAIGFAAFGLACGHPNGHTVYTRIQGFLPWIESIVWS